MRSPSSPTLLALFFSGTVAAADLPSLSLDSAVPQEGISTNRVLFKLTDDEDDRAEVRPSALYGAGAARNIERRLLNAASTPDP
jgi:hypothetical protein